MEDTLKTILQVIITTCVPILVAYVVKYVKSKIEQATSKIKDDEAAKFITEATNAVLDAVLFTSQTYVDELKKTNKFDVEAQKKALEIAKDAALEMLSADAIDYIEKIYGDVGTWITTKIEADIKANKQLGQYNVTR